MSTYAALATLSRRRISLSAHTPREIVVPLITPILFAVVIAPALNEVIGTFSNGLDYVSFVAVGTVGLLVPLNMMFAGLGVIVDREAGARRELLAAPIRRALLVISNLAVAMGIAALQIVVVIAAAAARGADFPASVTGVLWFIGAAVLFSIGAYGIAETMANRIPRQEEYIGAVPAVAIVPWFFAGALFPISALPGALTAFAKALPLTHALAVMRYGLGVDPAGTGLHQIWGMSDPAAMAALSLAVVAAFAFGLTAIAIRVFNRSAVQ
jgi:ABC-2 type transport system permease protein